MPVHHEIIMDRIPTLNEITDDHATSYWLFDAVRDSLDRDPIDALHDAEVLTMILAKRVNALTA